MPASKTKKIMDYREAYHDPKKLAGSLLFPLNFENVKKKGQDREINYYRKVHLTLRNT